MAEVYRVIVVDDEPVSADSLGEFLVKELPDTEVLVAYNAHQALKLLENGPCDLMVSDIQMPGMTGLVLAERVRQMYPDTTVLFLTGYDDFAYAYEAFKQNAVDYLLKTEGDEAILRAIQTALDKTRERRRIAARIRNAQDQYDLMLPVYRKQLLTEILLGHRIEEEKVPLDALELTDASIYLVIAHDVAPVEQLATRGQLVTIRAVEDIFSDALAGHLCWSESMFLDSDYIWLICVSGDSDYGNALFQLARKARTRLEEDLGIALFFLVSETSSSLEALGDSYARLKTTLSSEIARGLTGAAIIRQNAPLASRPLDDEQILRMNHLRRQVDLCAKALRDAAFDKLRAHADPVLRFIEEAPATLNAHVMEFESSLISLLLSYINRNRLGDKLNHAHMARPQPSSAYLDALIDALCTASNARVDYAMGAITHYILDYVEKHLSEDINISTLAEAAGYSTGYLSRVFKQQEGVSIHDYITMSRINLARELLCNTNLRVYEIAGCCGFDNSTYFIKVFKQHTGQTPQEFKQQAQQRSGQPR